MLGRTDQHLTAVLAVLAVLAEDGMTLALIGRSTPASVSFLRLWKSTQTSNLRVQAPLIPTNGSGLTIALLTPTPWPCDSNILRQDPAIAETGP